MSQGDRIMKLELVLWDIVRFLGKTYTDNEGVKQVLIAEAEKLLLGELLPESQQSHY